ncbi:MAG: transglutaminase domain-containing protein [Clostridiales bacterium]|nr:transglutaminase domain-containing protein [Clostridiales bacterium]
MPTVSRLPSTRQPLVATLSMPLPDLIRRLKYAGMYQEAGDAIALWLKKDLPEMLRRRLLLEQERLRRLPLDYPYDRAGALERIRKTFPTVDSDAFDRLEKEGKIDYLFVDGVKRYHVRFAATMEKDSLIRKAFGLPVQTENPFLDPMIRTLRSEGSLSVRITLKSALSLNPDTFVPGTYRAWLPFPTPCAQQSDIVLEAGNPVSVSPASAPSCSAYFEADLREPGHFETVYSYTSTIRYADPLHAPAPAQVLYPQEAPVCDADLQEDHVHIRFTPYLCALAADLTEGAASDAEKAWRIYEFITTKVHYSFVRDYLLLDDLAEYCALNLRGDCGLQAILFITLCRICSIPARWQSGLEYSGTSVGNHDWAQFYLPGWGWLFADCSYGGSAFRAGSALRHAFYFGNLDPARMAANRCFMADLTPDMQTLRRDPYDSQSGEMERVGSTEPLQPSDYTRDAELVQFTVLAGEKAQ